MKLVAPHKVIDAPVALPSSKSISNRLLIIQALSEKGNVIDLSDAQDTVILQKMLKEMSPVMDVGHAGTAFRFLTAYLASTEGEFVLTGSDRMKNRPIGILVNALRELGADIQYTEKEGYAPLRIVGKPLKGGAISVESNISSQFISALLLIAPYMDEGLKITLTGEVVSSSYLEMTVSLMNSCGVDVVYEKNQITIPYGNYDFTSIRVEKDWSAISFWYELVLIGELEHLLLENVQEESIQGDAFATELFGHFGVESLFDENGLHLHYNMPVSNSLPRIVDFSKTPDLVQPFVVALSSLNENYVLAGTSTLQYKETNRGMALKKELNKFGGFIDVAPDSILVLQGIIRSMDPKVTIETYEDHRMAMSFAPLAMIYGEINIEKPEVVKKSYPDYWNQLERLGFQLD